MRDERGMTVAELVITIPIFLVVFTAIMMMVQVATHNQDRVARRVAVNQKARPELTRLMDQLHSACVAPAVAPILAGSTSNSLIFISKAGEEVSPTPDKHIVTLSGGTLSESIYPGSGSAPPWTYSPTPSSTRELLTGVSSPALFRYYKYEDGQVSTTPLPTPLPNGLSQADAATTVQVAISFTYSTGAGNDPNAPITLSDSATLRLEPASEDTSEVNLPCV
jgi:hypothetical protein